MIFDVIFSYKIISFVRFYNQQMTKHSVNIIFLWKYRFIKRDILEIGRIFERNSAEIPKEILETTVQKQFPRICILLYGHVALLVIFPSSCVSLVEHRNRVRAFNFCLVVSRSPLRVKGIFFQFTRFTNVQGEEKMRVHTHKVNERSFFFCGHQRSKVEFEM